MNEPAAPAVSTPARRDLLVETLLVLGVSLGQSAVYAILAITRRLTEPVALSAQQSRLNAAVTPDRPWLDAAYQLAGIGFGVVPALLALFLLRRTASGGRRIGWDLTRPGRDLLTGAGLALLIGVPGLGLYVAARAIGINTHVVAAGLGQAWWVVPILVLAAVQNAVLEEVVMVGYLFTRWAQAGLTTAAIVLTSAVIRGTYHLYQGFGGFIGNLAMGLILGVVYARTRRVLPLVIAHTFLDVAAFVGYTLLSGHVSWL